VAHGGAAGDLNADAGDVLALHAEVELVHALATGTARHVRPAKEGWGTAGVCAGGHRGPRRM
jgi:hypothetical protein